MHIHTRLILWKKVFFLVHFGKITLPLFLKLNKPVQRYHLHASVTHRSKCWQQHGNTCQQQHNKVLIASWTIICHVQHHKTSATNRPVKQLTYTADWSILSTIIIALPNTPAFQLRALTLRVTHASCPIHCPACHAFYASSCCSAFVSVWVGILVGLLSAWGHKQRLIQQYVCKQIMLVGISQWYANLMLHAAHIRNFCYIYSTVKCWNSIREGEKNLYKRS